jgi:hypothetical protein
MVRVRMLAFGMLVGLAIPAVVGAEAQTQGESAPTEVRLFLLFNTGGGSAGLMVTDRVQGECFAGSLASPGRPDAWRCMAGSRILDPCYQGLAAGHVQMACPRAPWSAEATLLTPTAEPPRGEANRLALETALPWALELADGSRCTLTTGATWVAAGMRVNYGCEGGGRFVVGEPERSQPRWRVFVWTPERAIAARQIGVAVAWW